MNHELDPDTFSLFTQDIIKIHHAPNIMYDTSHRICYLLYKNDVLKYFLYTFLILMIHESVHI